MSRLWLPLHWGDRSTSVKQHKDAVRKGETEKLAIAQHLWTTQHSMNWGNIHDVDKDKDSIPRKIREALYTHQTTWRQIETQRQWSGGFLCMGSPLAITYLFSCNPLCIQIYSQLCFVLIPEEGPRERTETLGKNFSLTLVQKRISQSNPIYLTPHWISHKILYTKARNANSAGMESVDMYECMQVSEHNSLSDTVLQQKLYLAKAGSSRVLQC